MNNRVKIIYYLLTYFIGIFIASGCIRRNTVQENQAASSSEYTRDTIKNIYARGFSIESDNNNFLLTVRNPWQGASGIEYTYRLVTSNNEENIDNIPTFITPVKRVICMSTTHVGMLEVIDELPSIKGVSGKQYIYNEYISGKAKDGEVKDIGYDTGINYELMLSLKPDVVFIYGVAGENGPVIKKMQALGLKPVFVAEYLEESPLGKAEWIKFISCFFNKLDIATDSFLQVSRSYEKLRSLTENIPNRPVTITGLPWNNTWYVNGGLSFTSILIHDAGASYFWNDRKTRDAFPVDPESVITSNRETVFWLNPGTAESKKDILAADARLAHIRAFKKNNIYNNNARVNESGGNDYWESGVVHPDIVLKDLICIFHPELLENRELYYYKKVE